MSAFVHGSIITNSAILSSLFLQVFVLRMVAAHLWRLVKHRIDPVRNQVAQAGPLGQVAHWCYGGIGEEGLACQASLLP